MAIKCIDGCRVMGNLSLIDRESSHRELYRHSSLIGNGTSTERQQELAKHYKRSDFLCHCVSEPVRMHIKYRLDSGLYYLADNASSPHHEPDCDVARTRRQDKETDAPLEHSLDQWELPEELNLVPKERAPKGQEDYTPAAPTKKRKNNTAPLLERIVYTLLDDSFACYYHGRTTTPFTMAIELNDKEHSLSALKTHSKEAFKLYYGENGEKFAQRSLLKQETMPSDTLLVVRKLNESCDKEGFHFKVLANKAGNIEPVREYKLKAVSGRCAVPVVRKEEKALLESLERWVKGARESKAFFGRRMRPWVSGDKLMESPIIAGMTTPRGKKVRFITLVNGIKAFQAKDYEQRFNATYVPADLLLTQLIKNQGSPNE